MDQERRSNIKRAVELENCADDKNLLSIKSDYQKLVYTYNQTEKIYSQQKNIHELFEEQVYLNPNNIAIIDNNKTFSYFEVNKYANKLANLLLKNSIKVGDYVLILLDRSYEMIASLISVLKCGAVYVPVEPSFTDRRLASIIQIIKPSYIITSHKYLNRLINVMPDLERHFACVCVDEVAPINLSYLNYENIKVLDKNDLKNISDQNPRIYIDSDKLAYVIFTSGTTGKPKGVMIAHKSVINVIEWVNSKFNINAKDKILFVTSICFDLSVYDIFGTLLAGAQIRLADSNQIKEPSELLKIICNEGITIWDSAPPALQQLMPYIFDAEELLKSSILRLVLLSGDWIPLDMPTNLQNKFKNLQVVSLGGATETTIWSNYYIINETKPQWNSIPYGNPIQNAKYYVLDDALNPLPENQVGELYIGGDCLSIGYINNRELTEKKFIKNPFLKSGKIYKTGDLAKWTTQGYIELIGRIDDQVKIRGYRVELGEIRNAISKNKIVKESLVRAIQDDNKQKTIVSYIVKDNDTYDKDIIIKDSLKNWATVFDTTYNQDNDIDSPFKNFSGWNSSYTGKKIPEIEMTEWLDNTVDNILDLNPKKVLEIGCGTGMLLFHIAYHCVSYTASDISKSAINYISENIHHKKFKNVDIKLFNNQANDFKNYKNDLFDTIIINSVSQYFPSVDYFLQVLDNAIKKINNSGCIFIGDIRNYDLLNEFYLSLILREEDIDIHSAKVMLKKARLEEKELLISPKLFLKLKDKYKNITCVEVLSKKGKYENELNLFRYDVILYINQSIEIPCVKEIDSSCISVTDIKNIMANNDGLLIKNIQIRSLKKLCETVSCIKDIETFNINREEDSRKISDIFNNTIFSDNLNWEKNKITFTDKQDYKFKYLLNPEQPYICHMFVCKNSLIEEYKIDVSNFLEDTDLECVDFNEFSNIPFIIDYDYRDELYIKSSLKDYLPEYMIPEKIFFIDKIPVTINGKVAWDELPTYTKFKNNKLLKAPESEIEKELLDLWKQILKIDNIGTECNFFKLGGHSLKASLLIYEINKKFGIDIPVKSIFEFPTVKGLSAHLEKTTTKNNYSPIPSVKVNKVEVTSEQKRIFILNQLIKNNTSYNIIDVTKVEGDLDVEKFQNVISKIIDRHVAFRTAFKIIDGHIMQSIFDNVNADIEIIHAPNDFDVKEGLSQIIRPFHLDNPPLIRFTIVDLENKNYIIILQVHHIVLDGVSMAVLKKEISALYNGEKLIVNKIDYNDYSVWQNKRIYSRAFELKKQYWKDELQDYFGIAEFTSDFTRPSNMKFLGTNKYINIKKFYVAGFKDLANDVGTTLYSVLVSIYFILLYKYTGQKDIILGTVVSNRPHPDLKNIVGMFVNTLPLRINIQPDLTYKDFLQVVHNKIQMDFENQDYPFEFIIEGLTDKTSCNKNPLFSALIALQNMELESFKLNNTTSERVRSHNKRSKFDISFIFNEFPDELELEVEYSTELFKEETIDKIIRFYLELSEQILLNSNAKVCDLLLEKPNLINATYNKLNGNSYFYNKDLLVHELICRNAEIIPDKEALYFSGKSLNYRDLNYLSDCLCQVISEYNLKRNSVIGVLMNSSFEMVISMLAILKCGHIFMLIDPKYPEDRINYMLEDSNAQLLLFNNNLNKKVIYKISQTRVNLEDINNCGNALTKYKSDINDIAYLIYTSGSTGNPKGVKILNDSLLNLCIWHNEYYKVTMSDRATQYAGNAFDACIWEVLPYLVKGATVYIIDENIKLDVNALNEFYEKNNITVSFLPTQVCETFMNLNNRSLRCLLTGGDRLKSFCENNYLLYNNYGPTENTVVTTSFLVKKEEANIPIGKPIYNTKVYILDRDDNKQPKGVPGEMAISGAGVAAGYVNNIDLTKEKFVKLKGSENEIIYKTGDKVRLRDDGNIEFIGRCDNQVKVRGYRIELNEVEYNLGLYPGIKSAIVLNKQDKVGQSVLCCYYTSDESIKTIDIKNFLLEKLPGFMVPQYFRKMDRIPLTANGKINYSVLKEISIIEDDCPQNENNYINNDSKQKVISDIWKKVFGIKNIDVNTNFFELGGDSIKAMQLIANLHSLGYKIEISDLFSHPTIYALTDYLKDYLSEPKYVNYSVYNQSSITYIDFDSEKIITGELLPTAIQKWYMVRSKKDLDNFNMYEFLHFKEHLNIDILKATFKILSLHHDVLRTKCQNIDDLDFKFQICDDKISNTCLYMFDYINKNVDRKSLEEDYFKVKSCINIKSGINIGLGVFRLQDGDHLLICINHMLIDAYSWKILLEDMMRVYNMLLSNKSIQLPSKTASFKEWSECIYDYANSCDFSKEIQFWDSIYDSSNNIFKTIYESDFKDFGKIHINIETEHIQKLIRSKIAINEILISALVKSIINVFSVENVLINLESYGRDIPFVNKDISRTVGWFTVKYPILILAEKDLTVAQILPKVRNNLKNIPNKGFHYDVIKYIKSQRLSLFTNFEPTVSFNYLGQYNDLELGDSVQRSEKLYSIHESIDVTRFFDLDINSRIINEKMHIELVFNKNIFQKETIKQLCECYKTELEKLIDICSNNENEVEKNRIFDNISEEEFSDVLTFLNEELIDID